MVQKLTLTACLVGSCVICLTLVLRAEATQPVSGEVFKPVAPVDGLMYGQMTFFKRIGSLLPQAKNPKSLHEIGEAAYALSELANVNRFNRDKDDYRTWAAQLRDTCVELAKEADKEANANPDQLKQIYERIKATCQSCHDVYQ